MNVRLLETPIQNKQQHTITLTGFLANCHHVDRLSGIWECFEIRRPITVLVCHVSGIQCDFSNSKILRSFPGDMVSAHSVMYLLFPVQAALKH